MIVLDRAGADFFRRCYWAQRERWAAKSGAVLSAAVAARTAGEVRSALPTLSGTSASHNPAVLEFVRRGPLTGSCRRARPAARPSVQMLGHGPARGRRVRL
jgi:hypothetical protein